MKFKSFFLLLIFVVTSFSFGQVHFSTSVIAKKNAEVITGSGTYADPYMLYNADHLNIIRDSTDVDPIGTTTYWELANDIDMSEVTHWVPIAANPANNPWTGSINGAGYTIKNLTIDTTINATRDHYIGLFGNLGAGDAGGINDDIKVIRNLKLDGIHIYIDGEANSRNLYIGILTGLSAGYVGATEVEIDSLIITNSSLTVNLPTTTVGSAKLYLGGMSGQTYRAHHLYIDVDINVTTLTTNPRFAGEGLGGITGNTNNSMKYSAFVGTINVSSEGLTVGGIIGFFTPEATADSLINCYVRSAKIQSVYYTGGLIGMNESRASTRVRNCYVQIDILHAAMEDTPDYDGYLIGYTEASGPEWTSNYADTQAVVWDYVWDGVSEYNIYDRTLKSWLEVTGKGADLARTTTEMKTQGTFIDWDFTNIWGISESINDGYPYLLWKEE